MRIGCHSPDNLCLDDLKSFYKVPNALLVDEPNYRFIFHAGYHSFTIKELYESNSYHHHYREWFIRIVYLQNFQNIIMN